MRSEATASSMPLMWMFLKTMSVLTTIATSAATSCDTISQNNSIINHFKNLHHLCKRRHHLRRAARMLADAGRPLGQHLLRFGGGRRAAAAAAATTTGSFKRHWLSYPLALLLHNAESHSSQQQQQQHTHLQVLDKLTNRFPVHRGAAHGISSCLHGSEKR
jgi:hypothetical protein